ncbi:hypothetical protein AAG570_002903 [Ranatra chinensis]|uniref:Uncharacterized protein n=1 Tax=Ranatra chinensis TaxID=642074 RepID=A0ABD0YRZ7_9HEMI
MASKRRNMFYENKKQETTAICHPFVILSHHVLKDDPASRYESTCRLLSLILSSWVLDRILVQVSIVRFRKNTHMPWFVKNDTEERNARAKKAYTALLTVTAKTPDSDNYRNFSDKHLPSMAPSSMGPQRILRIKDMAGMKSSLDFLKLLNNLIVRRRESDAICVGVAPERFSESWMKRFLERKSWEC